MLQGHDVWAGISKPEGHVLGHVPSWEWLMILSLLDVPATWPPTPLLLGCWETIVSCHDKMFRFLLTSRSRTIVTVYACCVPYISLKMPWLILERRTALSVKMTASNFKCSQLQIRLPLVVCLLICYAIFFVPSKCSHIFFNHLQECVFFFSEMKRTSYNVYHKLTVVTVFFLFLR